MAFRATNQIPEAGYTQVRTLALNIKGRVVAARAQLGSPTSFEFIWRLRTQLFEAHKNLGVIKAIPGIGQYAKDQENDANYSIGVEFAALQAAIDDARVTIDAQLPKDANKFLLVYSIGTGASLQSRMFTALQTAGIRDKLQVIENAIV